MKPQTSRLQTSVGAGATAVQILVGADVEFLTQASLVSMWAAQSATGLLIVMKNDSNQLMPTAVPNINAAAGRLLQNEDQLVDQVALPAGTRLKIEATNPTGGALTLETLVIADPIPAGMY